MNTACRCPGSVEDPAFMKWGCDSFKDEALLQVLELGIPDRRSLRNSTWGKPGRTLFILLAVRIFARRE